MKHHCIRILALLLALMLLMLVAGCDIEIAGSAAQQDGGVLNFYVFEPDYNDAGWYSEPGADVLSNSSRILQSILRGFQTDRIDASVTVTTFSSVKEYTDRVQSELKAGGGPDGLIYAPGLFY